MSAENDWATGANPDRTYDVVAIGETMVQLVPQGERLVDADAVRIGIGGAESNTASYLAAAGHSVAWVSAVGDDPFGQRMLREISAYGVDVSRVLIDRNAPTAVYFKDPTPTGTTVYYYRRGSAAAALTAATADLPDLSKVRVVHMSGITIALSPGCAELVSHVRGLAKAAGALFSFDVNYRPALWSVDEAAPALLAQARASDLVFVGLDEANVLWGCETPEQVRDLLPNPELVVKDGDVGATSFDRDGAAFVPARAVDVVEPVGAGDAFAAGYLHGLLGGASAAERLESGHAFAGVALRSLHDVAPREEVEAVVAAGFPVAG